MTYDEYIQDIIDKRGRFGVPNGEYKECHHILPKCMGGNNNEENLIDLYAREHFEAHKLLALENPNNRGLQAAWLNMTMVKNDKVRRTPVTAEEFEEARIACSKAMSGSGNPMYGVSLSGEKAGRYNKPFSEESKKKISEHHADVSGDKNPMFGKHHSEETRAKISAKNRGRKYTEEQKKRLSESRKGKFSGSSNPSAKKIYQYDKDWNFVAEYDCGENAVAETGYGYSTIINACSSEKLANGYYWTHYRIHC